MDLFEKVSCNKKQLRACLEQKSYTSWSSLDDIAVKMGPESPEWKHIIKEKGSEECMRRKVFLGIDVDAPIIENILQ